MNQVELMKHMVNELDWQAEEFLKYNDTDVKDNVKYDFKQRASAYNALLRSIYGMQYKRFSLNVEKYISERKEENWR